VPVDPRVVADVAAGKVQALLVTSGSVAEQVQAQFGPVPETTLVACIGPRTAKDAAALGLRVDLVAEAPSAEALIEALSHVAELR
jgi:uroporphyrinogen-III synthase